MEHNIPIVVFNFKREGNIQRAIAGESIGTRVLPATELGE
jgi:uridylate kinase